MSVEKDIEEVENSPDIHFDPIVNLPPVELKSFEEDEEQMLKLRGKLYRYDGDAEPPEWKERGVGDIKILRNKLNDTCRIVMRRDKTLKICANHFIMPIMELKPNCGSDRAWVWRTPADFADEKAKAELLAIRFKLPEDAQLFREKFDTAKALMEKFCSAENRTGNMGKPVNEVSESDSDDNDDSPNDSRTDQSKSNCGDCNDTGDVTKKLDELTVSADDCKEKSPTVDCDN